MKKLNIYLLFAFTAIFLSSCSFENVDVGKIKGVNLVSVEDGNAIVEVLVPVKNPNKTGFTISKVNIDLTINGVEMGRVTQEKKIHIKANSDETYPVLFKAKLKENITSIPKLVTAALTGKKVDIKVDGYIKARKFIFSKKFEINEKTAVNLFNKRK